MIQQVSMLELARPTVASLIGRIEGGERVMGRVEAEVGAGKTTLAQAIGRAARRAGCRTVELHLAVGIDAPPVLEVSGPEPRPRGGTHPSDGRPGPATSSTRSLIEALETELAAATDGRPTIVIMDDPDRWEAAALEAVMLAIAQCRAEGFGCFALQRTRFTEGQARIFGDIVTLRPVTVSEAVVLVERRGLDRDLAIRCWRIAGGNPGALLALATAVEGHHDHDAGFDLDSVRVGEPFRSAGRQLLAALPAELRSVLEVAALDDSRRVNAVIDAVETLVDTVDGEEAALQRLGALEELGLIEVGPGGEIAWIAPGLRLGIRSVLALPRRTEVHRRLTAVRPIGGGDRVASDEFESLARLVAGEQYASTRRVLAEVLARGAASSDGGLAAMARCELAEVDFRCGEWGRAQEQWTRLDVDCVDPVVEASVAASLARLEAARGHEVDCRRHARIALDLAVTRGLGLVELQARRALGLLELGLGDVQASLAQFDAADRAARTAGLDDPGLTWSGADHAEAAWRAGDHESALGAIESLSRCARRGDRAWARGAVARCLGLRTGRAELFGEAVFEFSSIGAEFDTARSLLGRSDALVAGDADAARADLHAARRTFERLGAHPWREVADERLRRLDQARRPTEPSPAGFERLTRAEYRVAVLIGNGATNREASERLRISARTVDAHLRSIFRKLGISSRVRLARLLALDHPAARSASE